MKRFSNSKCCNIYAQKIWNSNGICFPLGFPEKQSVFTLLSCGPTSRDKNILIIKSKYIHLSRVYLRSHFLFLKNKHLSNRIILKLPNWYSRGFSEIQMKGNSSLTPATFAGKSLSSEAATVSTTSPFWRSRWSSRGILVYYTWLSS